jgi:DNA-binding NtrC family response regulator
MGRLLIIERDDRYKEILSRALSCTHQLTVWADSAGDDLPGLQKELFDLIILDLYLNRRNLFERIKRIAPLTPVVVTNETAESELVVRMIKEGAFDFVPKPYTAEKIALTVNRALEQKSLKLEVDYLRRQQDTIYDYDQIIAASPPMEKIMSTLKKLASSDSTMLITGESGTGKSFLSGTIHFNSPRKSRPFIKINCANIPETLLESELFGHERGAFTGATKTRTGRLEQANGGTIFLDEIGELSPALQAKLLRVLEERAFERLGGNQTIRLNIRIIVATNRVLEELVANGAFREDLYYRINVVRVHLPPLRERQECIEPLSYYLLGKICRSLKKRIDGFSPPVLAMLNRYSWPGNIRQLANVIERAVLLQDGYMITNENISLPEPFPYPTKEAIPQEDVFLDEQEKYLILNALERSLWIQKDAAERLGITPRALNYKIRKFGITHPRWRKNK